MAMLLYQGHGSYRIQADDGFTIYVDPYVGEGYDLPADLILVTHQHHDHNNIELVTKKPTCKIISNFEALKDSKHNTFTVNGIEIESVEAKNRNHNPKQCVGFMLTIDEVKIYAAGDTSKTEQMKGFSDRQLDYALLPCDGIFNMGLKEAAECASIIGAKHNIPIHMKPGKLFDQKRAEKFEAPNRMIIRPGQEIAL